MTRPSPDRLYWAAWLVAAGLTGIVAGFMLGHALILAPFLDWLLTAAPPGFFGQTYPRFRDGAGQTGLRAYYAIVGLQVLAAVAFFLIALRQRRHRAAAVIAAAAGAGWVVVHYASGFGALEAEIVRNVAALSARTAPRFVAWNTPIHYLHALALAVALGALLWVPLSAGRPRE